MQDFDMNSGKILKNREIPAAWMRSRSGIVAETLDDPPQTLFT
jgi:hypothetical protein